MFELAVDILQKWLNVSDKQPEIGLQTLTSLEDAIVKLRELLAAACEYVKNVVVCCMFAMPMTLFRRGKSPRTAKLGKC